jgi:hypothetical protein
MFARAWGRVEEVETEEHNMEHDAVRERLGLTVEEAASLLGCPEGSLTNSSPGAISGASSWDNG